MPGKLTTEQALHFAESLMRGGPDRWDILKTVVENKIREVL
jgi:pyruvate dehydrogenase (quinone)